MTLKETIREKALELEFEDVGFTGVQPLDLYIREIDSRPPEMYGWVQTERFNTRRGAGVGIKARMGQITGRVDPKLPPAGLSASNGGYHGALLSG